jgi:hypothetical protein
VDGEVELPRAAASSEQKPQARFAALAALGTM